MIERDSESEMKIWAEFMHGGLAFIDAINQLEKLGFDPKEAERMVSEWADSAETSQLGECK
jgi:hypothetical protein